MVVRRASLSSDTIIFVTANSRSTSTLTIPGVQLSDIVVVERLDQFPDALAVWGRVTELDVVTVVMFNPTAATISIVPGTVLRVAVIEE